MQFWQILIDGFAVGSLYALGAMGFALIFGVSGVLNLSHCALLVAAVVAAWAAANDLLVGPYAGAAMVARQSHPRWQSGTGGLHESPRRDTAWDRTVADLHRRVGDIRRADRHCRRLARHVLGCLVLQRRTSDSECIFDRGTGWAGQRF